MTLKEAEHWLAKRPEDLTKQERACIRASIALQAQLQQGKPRKSTFVMIATELAVFIVAVWFTRNLVWAGIGSLMLAVLGYQFWHIQQVEKELESRTDD